MFEALNAAYEPLYRRAMDIYRTLKADGLGVEWGYYAFHARRVGDEYVTEYFPIPVIRVKGLCDIGVELDHLFVEFHLSRADALEFDFRRLLHPFEVFGVEDCLNDFYRAGMRMEETHTRIAASPERAVSIEMTFDPATPGETLLALVRMLPEFGAHMDYLN